MFICLMFHPRMTSAAMELLLLLPAACLCLLTWSGGAFGDETGLLRVFVEEGGDVVLPCSLSSKKNAELMLFDWKKDRQEVFLYDAGFYYGHGRTGQDERFKGRVSHFPEELKHGNASVIIRDTKVADGGNYTCDFPRLQPQRQIFHIKLVVGRVLKDRTEENIAGAAPEPSVTILDETKERVLLQCEVHGASPKPGVVWQDGAGNVLPSPEPTVTERDGRFDVTLQTTVTKTDHYRCVATQEEIGHQTHREIFVLSNGAASKPSVTTLEQTNDRALLQCEVLGASPKPSVVWKDGGGNVLPAKDPQVTERGGSYDIILQTTVTKTDRYRCVATQEEINHEVSAEIYEYISEFPTGWVVAGVLGVSIGAGVVVLLLVLIAKGFITLNCKKGSQTASSVSLDQRPDHDLKEALTV